jgi:hypothetical protein
MGVLLEVYDGMQKEAAEQEAKAILTEQVEALDKYAALASNLMQEHFPNDHTKDDILELADRMIEHDIAVENETVKTAQAQELAAEYVKVAEALLQEEYKTDYTPADVEKLAEKLIELDEEVAISKEAEAIVGAGFVQECEEAGMEKEAAIEAWASLKEMSSKAIDFLTTRGTQVGKFVKRNPGTAALVGGTTLAAGVGLGRMSKD